jgi:hypothetical protein
MLTPEREAKIRREASGKADLWPWSQIHDLLTALDTERAAREAAETALVDCEDVIRGLIRAMDGEGLTPGKKTLAVLARAQAALADTTTETAEAGKGGE